MVEHDDCWWCGQSEEAVVAAETGSCKLGSELRHGTGKPMMVLYKDEGDGVVNDNLSSLVLLWKNVEAALANWATEGTQLGGCRCRSQF